MFREDASPRRPRSSSLRRGRHAGAGMVYLLTITTHQREKLFADWAVGRFVVAEMRRLHDAALADQRAETLAWVLMPDHWHWLIRLSDPPDLSGIVNLAKGRAARAINLALTRSGPVWQSGYHDRAMRSADNLRDAARYIVANPLRAGLVQRIGDYPLWDCVWLLDGG